MDTFNELLNVVIALSAENLLVLKRICVGDVELAQKVVKVCELLPDSPRRWLPNGEEEFPLVINELRRETNFLVQTQLDQINAVPFYVHIEYISKSREIVICKLNACLVKDLSSIVVSYHVFDATFKVGMHLAVKDTVDRWYISEIKEICLVGTLAFVLVSYLTWEPTSYDEWILCTSSRLKCLYDDNGDLIAKIEFILPLHGILDQLPKQKVLNVFDVYWGGWSTDTVHRILSYLSTHLQLMDS